MNKPTRHPMAQSQLARVLPLVVAALLSACEGESRPFQEAVEVQSLGLTGIQITRPVIEQADTFVINPGQQAQLGLVGINNAQADVTLSTAERSWRSSNPSAVNVSEDGVITGQANGEADISVSIGGIESAPLPISVDQQTLEAVESIQALDEDDVLEPCLPEEFFAIGRFANQTLRPLYDAAFAYTAADGASITPPSTDRATVLVNATTPGAIALTATAGNLAPASSQLTVLNTLTGITMLPSPAAVDVDATLEFTATGTYNNDGIQSPPLATGADETPPVDQSGSRSVDITDNVQWEVVAGTSNARVSDAGSDKGSLTGLLAGTASLRASCGSESVEQLVTINDVSSSGSSELSFNIDRSDNTLVLGLSETFQLEVSQGSEFDEDELVTGDVQFSVANIGDTDTPIDLAAIESGLIRPLIDGGRARVTATLLSDDGASTLASGSITVRVSGP